MTAIEHMDAEQADEAGVFDPSRPVDRLGKVRAVVIRQRAEAYSTWMGAPLNSRASAAWAARYDALGYVLRLIDQP